MPQSNQLTYGQVQLEKFRQLQSMLPQSISFGMALAVLVVAILWRTHHAVLLPAWLAAQGGLSWWRLRVLRQFRQLPQDAREMPQGLARTIQLGCCASGVLWGLMAMLPYSSQDLQVPLFSMFILSGVTAAAATAMASELISAFAFQFSVFAFMVTQLLFVQSGSTYSGMGFTVILYCGFMAMWTRRMHRNVVAAIHMRLHASQRERILQQREARYRDLAHHDALTGLPNRLSWQARMPELLELAASGGTKVAVIYLDLDHFKDINDSRGHRCGDALLETAGARLRGCIRPNDLVVRMGGDEFIVVASDTQTSGQVSELAQRLASSIGQPSMYEGETFTIAVSMGIAIYPEHGTDADQLLKNADIALYQAKASGRNNFQFFVSDMSVAFSERIFIEQALGRALGTSQLFIEYQPIVDLETGRVTGLEALLRWQHPERGLIPPLTFVPIAEHCGLIDRLGIEVLQMVCQQLRLWQTAAVPVLPIAVNVSPRQFERGGLAESLLGVASDHQVSPALLQIEITETALMKSTGQEILTLQKLRQLGIRVLIDDFGIGYSSLNHLKSLAIDGLKIDRTFVRDMIDDERDAAIVAAIIGIARNLRIGVVAEGVESQRHVEHLRSLGCGAGQGNFLYAPLKADRCRELLEHAAQRH
jgi:diguanylate cyclase (GGDEF)-like protein